jgi:hypothetical protein
MQPHRAHPEKNTRSDQQNPLALVRYRVLALGFYVRCMYTI